MMSEPEIPAPTRDDSVPRYHPLMLVLGAVVAGVIGDRSLDWPLGLWWVAAAAIWLVWLAVWLRGHDRVASWTLLGAIACAAGGWHHCRWQWFPADELGRYASTEGQPVGVEAIAVSGPERLPAPPPDPMQIIPAGDRTRLELRVTAVRDGGVWRRATGRSRLTVEGHLLGVRAGDRLRIFARLSRPRPAMNPGAISPGDSARIHRRLSELWASYPDCVRRVASPAWWDARWWVPRLRTSGDGVLWDHLDHRRSGLAAAVLLGLRDELRRDQIGAFMETGTAHLLAISGLHVGIVAGLLAYALRPLVLPRRRAAVVVAAMTVFYALLTNARTPAIRATILVFMFCAAYWVGRRRPGFNSLAAAGLVVLIASPADLFRAGTQLSFLAVAALMWVTPHWFGPRPEEDPVQRFLRRHQSWPRQLAERMTRFFRDLALVSAVIWLVTLPLVMARFHLICPVALVLNTLLWLPMALALAAGFGVLAFSWLLPPVAVACGWLCDRTLWLIAGAIQLGRDLPGSHFWVPGPDPWWLAGFYGGLALLGAVPALRRRRRWSAAGLGLWIAIGLAAPWGRHREATLRCTVLAVGHGSAVVLDLPSGQTILYDAGQFSQPEIGARRIAACLWEHGTTEIDAVVLSHPDADHYNAVPGLTERFRIRQFCVPPRMFQGEDPAVTSLAESIRSAGVPIRVIHTGDRLDGHAGCRIKAIHPPPGGVPGSDNANCVVLAVQYQGHRILLPGDLEPPALDDLMARKPWDCDVLMAPHHGSRHSDPPGLADWCTPEWVIISGAIRADVRQTTASYRRIGARVLHTAESGAVRVRIHSGRLSVRPFIR